jgi:hypothetical protein
MKTIEKIILITVLLSAFAHAQIHHSRPRNNVGMELLGGTSDIAVFYERLSPVGDDQLFATRVGIGVVNSLDRVGYSNEDGFYSNSTANICLPIQLSLNLGSQKSFFETGIEALIIPLRDTDVGAPFTFHNILGYRYAPFKSKQLSFRATVKIPTLSLLMRDTKYLSGSTNIMIPSLSFGYSF